MRPSAVGLLTDRQLCCRPVPAGSSWETVVAPKAPKLPPSADAEEVQPLASGEHPRDVLAAADASSCWHLAASWACKGKAGWWGGFARQKLAGRCGYDSLTLTSPSAPDTFSNTALRDLSVIWDPAVISTPLSATYAALTWKRQSLAGRL